MKVLARVFGGIALLCAVLLVVGMMLPGRWEAEVVGTVPASPDSVHALLARPASWQSWMPWPEAGTELAGPEYGAGAGFRWDDPTYGSGRFTLVESLPRQAVGYRVAVEDGSIRIEGRLVLEPADAGTRIRWTERGSVGWNPLLGFAAMGMGDRQEAQLREALERLRDLLSGE